MKQAFERLGTGTLLHDMRGFHVRGTDVDGDPIETDWDVPSPYRRAIGRPCVPGLA